MLATVAHAEPIDLASIRIVAGDTIEARVARLLPHVGGLSSRPRVLKGGNQEFHLTTTVVAAYAAISDFAAYAHRTALLASGAKANTCAGRRVVRLCAAAKASRSSDLELAEHHQRQCEQTAECYEREASA